ncbi:amino acid ABC transporter substrate-binding protein [Alteromonas sp. ZYF713]|nr:amino acid ABC transporter substrate-binding protein [Alteromonas sp. ZYF713]
MFNSYFVFRSFYVFLLAMLLTGICLSLPVRAEKFYTIRVPAVVFEDNEIHAYFVEVLKLALDKTKTNELPVKIVPDPFNANQDRLLRQVKEGSTDVTWAVTSEEREREHLAVYFPLARGLLGYRVFLVHPDNQQTFGTREPAQLKQSLSVQGIGWPDTDIMRFNGYRVEEVSMTMMFKLIESKMADYFPRSVMEVEYELASRPSAQLAIEPHMAFYYPSPMYFFVSKRNRGLAQRLEKGLDLALADGSLIDLYNKQPFARSANKMLGDRHVIHLQNPILSSQSEKTLKRYKDFLLQH